MTIDLRVELFLPFAGEGFARKSEGIADCCAKQASNDAAALLALGNLVRLSGLSSHTGSISIWGFL
jgi:hypothetical protein